MQKGTVIFPQLVDRPKYKLNPFDFADKSHFFNIRCDIFGSQTMGITNIIIATDSDSRYDALKEFVEIMCYVAPLYKKTFPDIDIYSIDNETLIVDRMSNEDTDYENIPAPFSNDKFLKAFNAFFFTNEDYTRCIPKEDIESVEEVELNDFYDQFIEVTE